MRAKSGKGSTAHPGYNRRFPIAAPIEPMEVKQRIARIVNAHPIVLFMKGTPQFPMCGFSSQAVEALKRCGARFEHVNVLEDPEIRAHLPHYSNWKTFPQLFVHGELIGGADITVELYESGELERIVADAQGS